MTDNVQIALIGAVAGAVPSVIGLVNLLIARRNAAKLQENTDVTKSTHKLVNGRHTAALRAVAEKARRVATLTGTREDLKDADEAERALADHIAQNTAGH